MGAGSIDSINTTFGAKQTLPEAPAAQQPRRCGGQLQFLRQSSGVRNRRRQGWPGNHVPGLGIEVVSVFTGLVGTRGGIWLDIEKFNEVYRVANILVCGGGRSWVGSWHVLQNYSWAVRAQSWFLTLFSGFSPDSLDSRWSGVSISARRIPRNLQARHPLYPLNHPKP